MVRDASKRLSDMSADEREARAEDWAHGRREDEALHAQDVRRARELLEWARTA